MTDIDVFLLVVALIGTIAFSISGALVAIENKLDIFGVIILACVTACGGGLIRDTMLAKGFAMFTEWWYPLISVGVAVVVFLIMFRLRNLAWEESMIYKRTYMIIDALGLGSFVVVGALRAFNAGVESPMAVIFYSVLTCVGGGMLRDMMVVKIPVIFRKHIYAVAALVGAIIFYFMYIWNVNEWLTAISAILVVVLIRFFAFHYKLNLPKIPLKSDENNV